MSVVLESPVSKLTVEEDESIGGVVGGAMSSRHSGGRIEYRLSPSGMPLVKCGRRHRLQSWVRQQAWSSVHMAK